MFWLLLLVVLGLACALTLDAGGADAPPQVGESLVLAGTDPGRLFHGEAAPGSVRVRSTYLAGAPGAVSYEEGRDFVVDYVAGTVRRTEGSRIPDYRRNSLYGKRDFNHQDFPGFGNYRDFVFVDYLPRRPVEGWPRQEPQTQLLQQTRRKLAAGGVLKVCAFGDSITAGGDATAPELIYWQRWLAALRARHPKATITGVNSATGGDTTVQGLVRLEEKVLREQPDLVLIAFGMNDQNVGGVPEATFRANLGELVDRVRARTGAEVILLSSCLPNPNWHYTSGRMAAYGRITGEVAADRKCAFADVLANWKVLVDRKKPEDILANNVNHPNDFGHWVYFQVLERLGL